MTKQQAIQANKIRVQKKSQNRDKPSKTTENPPKDSQSNKYEKEAVVLPFLLRKPVSLR